MNQVYHGIWICKLRATVSRQHVDDDNLTPFLDIHQQVTQLPIVLVDQIDPFWAHLFKRLNC